MAKFLMFENLMGNAKLTSATARSDRSIFFHTRKTIQVIKDRLGVEGSELCANNLEPAWLFC